MFACNLQHFYTYSESIIGQLLNRCLAELPTITDRFFTGLVNTTSGYVEVESDGSHKWHPKSLSKLKIPKCISSVNATF